VHYRLLVVDLGSGEICVRRLGEGACRAYMGGRGIGARLMLDLVPPGTDPLGPDNLLMFLTGPLTGSLVPGATKHAVVTKSPATGAFLDCYSSGLVGVQLRCAGYDGLIVQGKAPEPSWMLIEDDRVQIRSARDLWGRDAFYCAQALAGELGEEGLGHAVIGPAGENLVRFACINNDFYRQAGRGGAGAVMGSKMLKAIAVRGSGGVRCQDVAGFLEFHDGRLEAAAASPGAKARKRAGTATTFDVANAAGMLPVRNFQHGHDPAAVDRLDASGLASAAVASVACMGCPTPCGKVVEALGNDGQRFRIEGPEYETLAMFGSNLGIDDISVVAEANRLCDLLGMDTISAGNIIGFLMECREKGILQGRFAGFDLSFGDSRGILRVLREMATRTGLGDAMAQGVRSLAEEVGNGSEAFAMHSKGLEFPGYDPRAAFGAALSYAVSPRGACHRRAWPPAKEILGPYPPYTVEGKAALVKEQFDQRNILHSLIVCDFPTSMVPLAIADYNRYLEHVVGVSYEEEELRALADRVETCIRLYNVRAGLKRSADSVPWRTLEEPMGEGVARGQCVTREGFERMLDEYYELRGWDSEGVPTEETLRLLGIEEGCPDALH